MSRQLSHLMVVVIASLTLLVAAGAAAEVAVDRSLPENGGFPRPELKPWTGFQGVAGGRALIDDFNRSDGPLGPDWTVQAASFQIISQAAHGGSLALATHNSATGDTVEMDISVNGSTATQYAAAVVNYGGGSTNLFIKIQNNGGVTTFTNGGCYTGNNGPSFGLGFFTLTQNFSTAHMAVTVDAARTVTLDLTNIDGGALPDQQYVCTGAPAAEGPAIGMGAYSNLEIIDNFADGPIPVELQSFTVE